MAGRWEPCVGAVAPAAEACNGSDDDCDGETDEDAVRGGYFKTYLVDETGREQVLGFHLPGELIGLDAIWPEKHQCNAVALDTASVCELPFADVTHLATQVPSLQQTMFRLLSRDIGESHTLAGDLTAEQRIAAFLDRETARIDALVAKKERLIELLQKPTGDMFWMFPVTCISYLGRDQLSPAAKAAMREAMVPSCNGSARCLAATSARTSTRCERPHTAPTRA